MWPKVPLLPGIKRLVDHLHKNDIPMAIATGSRRAKYELKTSNHEELFKLFNGKVVCSDDPQYAGMRGKPNPDIFLTAAAVMLGKDVGTAQTEPTEEQIAQRRKGLVLEDALSGVQAGKRAGMNGGHSRRSSFSA